MRATIVIPTYNEKKNIKSLVKKILATKVPEKIIIVDDNSPDGTGGEADGLAEKHSQVKVIHRKGKLGRGSAVIDGFKLALKDKEIKYFIEMDADFSHDPVELKELLKKAENYDIVVGSRYLPQSKIKNWGMKRRIFSKIANLYARLVLGVPISDYSNGYRCYSRSALEALDLDRIESRGYIVLSEIAFKLYKKGFKFGQIATIFVNREKGKSNLSLAEIIEAFYSVIKLRLKSGVHWGYLL
jgi:dolichol-phosphate mannosyltransferase